MAQSKRKKKFFNVEIPLIKKETQLQAYEIGELEGRFMKYDLTRILRGKATELQMKIKVKDGKAVAESRQIKLLPYYMKRVVRKGTNYVEDSFSMQCKNAQVKIKPFLVTRRKVSRAVRKALRNKCKEELINYCKSKSTDELFDEIVKNKLQKQLSLILKKVYPLSSCEIRILKVEKEKTEEKKEEKQENPKE